MLRAASAAGTIGARAVLVHAKDDNAKSSCEHFTFEPSPSGPYHRRPANALSPGVRNWLERSEDAERVRAPKHPELCSSQGILQ